MSLFCANSDEENDDNAVRQIRRIKMATGAQCVRLIQMAGTAMGMRLQLKGCTDDQTVQHAPVAGGSMDEAYTDWQLAWWTMVEWWLSTMWYCMELLVGL